MVEAARAGGFNTLLVQVRGRGDAYFSDGLEPRAAALAGQPESFDPLAATLTLAHELRLRVHAWVNVNLVSSAVDVPTDRTHVVYRRPEWLMVPATARPRDGPPRTPEPALRREAHAMDPVAAVRGGRPLRVADPRGVAGPDRLRRRRSRRPVPDRRRAPRLPPVSHRRLRLQPRVAPRASGPTCSTPGRCAIGSATSGRSGSGPGRRGPKRSPSAGATFRQRPPDRARRPRPAERAGPAAGHDDLRGGVPGSPPDAATRRLQDWRAWLDQDLLDVVCPMAYATDITGVHRADRRARGRRPAAARSGRASAPTACRPSQTIENIQIARRLGAAGIILFSYDSLVSPPNGPDYLAHVSRAAFGG